jgi:two-component system NarL family sensor kinase
MRVQSEFPRRPEPAPTPATFAPDVHDTLAGAAAGQPLDFVQIWQSLVDGLPEQIALLDADWNILVVNDSWTRTAELYGLFALMPGSNYVDFCRTKAMEGHAPAQDTIDGLADIMAGKTSSFRIVYNGSERWKGHDFQICVNRFSVGDQIYASITRYDVTELLELRRLREEFSDCVMRGQAEERRRLGREIHDSTMQLLAGLGLLIAVFRRRCDTMECQPILDEMDELLTEAQKEIRSISYLAHPPLLEKMSLAEALKSLVEGFSRRTDLPVTFEVVGDPQFCCPAAEGALYRVAQEALSNVHRHSKATAASVLLRRGKTMTHVVVADNGVGMPAHICAGVGLSGMRSRLAELGGRLFVYSSRRPGTAVIASVPAKKHINLGGDLALPYEAHEVIETIAG